MLTFVRRADPDIDGSHTARSADGLDKLKEACPKGSATLHALRFQVRADHFVLSIYV